MSTSAKKGTGRAGSGRPTFGEGIGKGFRSLWIFFILLILLCVNVSYLAGIKYYPPTYYFERVYRVSGAGSLVSSFDQTMSGGLRQELIDRITPPSSALPADITVQSGQSTEQMTVRVTADNYYNAENVMELFCDVYPRFVGGTDGEMLSMELVSETDSGTDLTVPFLERTVGIGAAAGVVLSLIWLLGYASHYRKTYKPAVSHRKTEQTPAKKKKKEKNSMKCLLELPEIKLRKRGNPEDQELLISNQYVDDSFRAKISDFCQSVQRRMDDKESSILLVTSSVAGEGKSMTAANLALGLTEDGNSVVLVQMNFGDTDYPLTAEGPGLLDYVHDSAELKDILHLVGKNLVVITPGTPEDDDDYAEIMTSFKVRDLLGQLKDTVDYVILDTAALTEAEETEVLLGETDEVLYVTRADQDSQEDLKEGLEILAGTGKAVLGFVMNYSQEEA